MEAALLGYASRILFLVLFLSFLGFTEIAGRPLAPERSESLQVDAVGDQGRSGYTWGSLLGSSPPTCMNKCQGCNPCRPVLITVGRYRHPGLRPPSGSYVSTKEYYPSVWKCKCGKKIFQP